MKNLSTAFLLLLMACQNAGNSNANQSDTPTTTTAATLVPKTPDTTTLAGRWYLQPVLPSDTAAGKIPWLDLNPGLSRFAGNSGCNSMHGKFYFSKTDSSLSFNDKIAISRMNCPGYNEPTFLKSLKSTMRYKLRNGTLTLIGEDHAELSHWTRTPATPPKVLKT
ncbi:MAG TPA: META domain-containing protein [Puia sp.]|nr:META domain-containing protein [Puia sp.]